MLLYALGLAAWALTLLWLGSPAAFGAAYTWDPHQSGTNVGGAGIWDPSSVNWWNGAPTIWAPGTDALFSGTAGGVVTLDAPESVGNMTFSTSGYTLSGNTLTVVSGGTITANQNATINSSIADVGGGVTFAGSAQVTLGNTFNTGVTGPVTVSGGTLLVNSTNPGGVTGFGNASSITINNASVVTNNNNALFGFPTTGKAIYINQGGLLADFAGHTSHLNAVVMDGGTLSAASANTAFGSWALDGGVSTPGNSDSRTSYITGGNLCLTQNSAGGGTQFNVGTGDTLFVSSQLTFCTSFTNGTTQFNLVVNGPGTLVLAGSNNFSTTTMMNGGTLLLANSAALLDSPLVISGGTVGFNNVTAAPAVSVPSLSGNGGTLLLTNTNGSGVNLSVGSTASTTYNGVLTGSSGSLTLAGGNLTLTGNNIYGSATIVNSGNLTLSGNNNSSGAITVNGGDLTLTGSNNFTGTKTLNGGVLILGNSAALGGGGSILFSSSVSGGTLQYTAANNVDYSSSFGTLGSQAWNINTNSQNITFSSNLKGSGSVINKFGLGQLTLAGTDTYTGGTNIYSGLLQFASSSSVDSFNKIFIYSGGALVASSGSANTVNGWLTTGRINTSSSGAIALTTSSTDQSISFTTVSNGAFPNLSLGAVGTVTYNGTIIPASNGYNLGGGGGTLILTGTALTSANNLTITNSGNVVLANPADKWSGTTTILPSSTLQLGDGLANTVTPVNSISNSGTLTILNTSAGTIPGSITGPGEVNAFGTSVMTLSGTSSSTGIFYTNGGTLNINGSLSTTGKTIFGSNLASAPPGPTVVNWNATGIMAPSTGGAFVGIADTGRTATLNVNGGSLNIVGATVFVGNTNGGGNVGTLNMTGGTVTVDNTHAFDIGGIGGGNVGSAGVVNVSGGYLSISAGTSDTLLGNGAITMAYTNNSSATINLTGGTLSTLRSFYMGPGTGSTATLNLNGGVLQASGTPAISNWFLGGVAVVAGTNGALIDTEGGTVTIESGSASSETISGPGSLIKLGSAQLTVAGKNSYQGQTIVDAGTLVLFATNGYTGGTVLNGGILMAQSDLSLGPDPTSFMYNNITLNGGMLRDNSQFNSLYLAANRGVYLGPNGGYLRAGWSNVTTVDGVISGGGPLIIASDGFGFSPPSQVYLANPANTYSSSTTIGSTVNNFHNLATLEISKLSNGGSVSSIGESTSAASNFLFNPGSSGTAVLIYTGTGDSTDRLFTITSGTNTVINSSGTGPLNFTNPGPIAFGNTQVSTLILGGTYSGSTPNTFAPQIADNGALHTTVAVNGSLWTLTGSNNTYSGGTVLSGGTLLLTTSNANSLQNNTVTVNGGNLAFAAGATSVAVAGLSGSGSGIVLQDANSSPVTLSVGGNGTSSTFAGILSGPGGLVKAGSGVLALAASQSYRGATVVNGGTLALLASAPTALQLGFNGTPADSSGNNNNATLVNSPSYTTGFLPQTQAINFNGTNQYATAPYSSSLNLTGAYTVSLWEKATLLASTSAVTVAAPALISTRNGENFDFDLQVSTSGLHGDIGNGTSWLTTAANSTVSLGLGWNLITVAVNTSGYVIYVNGQPTSDGTGTYSGTPVFMTTSSASVSLGSQEAGGGAYGNGGYFNGAMSQVQVFNSALSAVQIASLYNNGVAPTFNSALPALSPVTLAGGTTLDLGGGTQAIGSLIGSGSVINSTSSQPAVLTIGNDNSNQTFSGTISGNTSLTKVGSGTETLSGVNIYSGPTTINGGNLMYPSTAALPSSGPITINLGGGVVAQGAYSNANSWLASGAISSASSGAIVLAPGSTDTNVNFTTSPGYNTLSLGAQGAVTYAGSITVGANGYYLGGGGGTLTLVNALSDVAPPTSLTVNGPGEVLLRATPTYTGNTTITGGVLDLGGHILTTGVTVAFQGGTLQDGTVLNNGAYSATGGTVSATLQGAAALTMNGPGLLLLSATNNSYSGGTNINAGALQATNTGALPGYNVGGQVTVNSSAGLYLSVGGHGWSSPQIDALLAAANFFGGTLGMDTTAGNFNYNTAITQNLSLTSLGPNTLTLGGAENYFGSTTVSGGTLTIGAAGSLGGGTSFGSITIASGAVFNYGGAAIQTLGGQITGGGVLTKSGNGLLIVSDNNTYTGGTNVTSGVLSATNPSSLGAGTATLSGGTLSLQAGSYANAVNVTQNADIDVSQSLQAAIGPLTITAGTLRLSSTDSSGNAYSLAPASVSLGGNATLNAAPSAGGGAGTLVLGTASQSGSMAVTSGGSNTINATLVLDGNVGVNAASGAVLTLAGSVSDNGLGYGLTLTGNGDLVLSGTAGYSGETVVDSGTLILTSPIAIPSGNALIVGANNASVPLGLLATFAPAGGSSPAVQSVSAVPEPSALALLAVAALAVGIAARRGRNEHSPSGALNP